MNSGVYCIHNIINGKSYIGKTVDIDDRWRVHKSRLNNDSHENKYLQHAWNKHGGPSFIFVLLELIDEETEQNKREKYYIKEWQTKRVCGYNLTDGGEGTSGLLFTEEHREKLSVVKRGEKNPFYGKTHTEKTKQKMSAAQTGKVFSPEHKKNISRAAQGKRSGEQNPAAKLTWEVAEEIRERYQNEKISQAKLGEEYGVNQTKISAVINNKTWKIKRNT